MEYIEGTNLFKEQDLQPDCREYYRALKLGDPGMCSVSDRLFVGDKGKTFVNNRCRNKSSKQWNVARSRFTTATKGFTPFSSDPD